mmetsp:Transcript_5642/g.9845  ORF Transcript_5642/g.9845 Transcript_5642/m.9845 type:complete len:84 (+) Transcript_5642:269-520(+)
MLRYPSAFIEHSMLTQQIPVWGASTHPITPSTQLGELTSDDDATNYNYPNPEIEILGYTHDHQNLNTISATQGGGLPGFAQDQ